MFIYLILVYSLVFNKKHILDSLFPVKFISSDASLIDIGTGGGFSGIPLKFFMPSLTITLVDSSRKKAIF